MTLVQRIPAVLIFLALLGADTPAKFRVATFNASLNREKQGAFFQALETGDDPQIKNVAEVIQIVRPDILLINEFDYDENGQNAKLFQEKYLSVAQNKAQPLNYEFRYVPTVNTGYPSHQDLDNSGKVEEEIGSRGFGNDAYGYGQFPGQYGFVIYSKFPLETSQVQDFQKLLWKDMPAALVPTKPDGSPWYSSGAWNVFRLSSKNHIDLPIRMGTKTLHLLASHPTPPAFDGPEKRNAKRNHDEVRIWADYLSGGDAASYLGKIQAPATFVILGDLNADPNDGGAEGSINQLLKHPKINASFVPKSEGGPEAAKLQGQKNTTHTGDPAADTADFNDNVGNLRADYVLPSKDLKVLSGAIFWPTMASPEGRLVAMTPTVATSDHRLVYLDLSFSTDRPVIAAKTAKDHIGELVTVAMNVQSSKRVDGSKVVYLDSEEDFRSDVNLAVVIKYEIEPEFKKLGVNAIEDDYLGKNIEVTGTIVKERNYVRLYVGSAADLKLVK